MASLGRTSQDRLATCHPKIQRVIRRAEKENPEDFSVVCGRRNEPDQEQAFREGKSDAHYGESPHNEDPSEGIDVAPYRHGRILWDDGPAFVRLATHVLAAASAEGVKMKWGGHFKATRTRQYGWDKGHWELTN